MSLFGAFDKTKHLDELNDPLPNASGGMIAPATRQAAVIANLGITATAAEINATADMSSGFVNVTDAATYTVLAADSGKLHIMPNFTSSCTLTLPAAAAGLRYKFISKAVAADAQNWKFASAAVMLGGVSFVDNDAGAGADEMHAGVFSNGSSNDNLTVTTPSAGTWIEFFCDGTNWIACGWVNSATAPAFSDA